MTGRSSKRLARAVARPHNSGSGAGVLGGSREDHVAAVGLVRHLLPLQELDEALLDLEERQDASVLLAWPLPNDDVLPTLCHHTAYRDTTVRHGHAASPALAVAQFPRPDTEGHLPGPRAVPIRVGHHPQDQSAPDERVEGLIRNGVEESVFQVALDERARARGMGRVDRTEGLGAHKMLAEAHVQQVVNEGGLAKVDYDCVGPVLLPGYCRGGQAPDDVANAGHDIVGSKEALERIGGNEALNEILLPSVSCLVAASTARNTRT